MNEHVKRLSFVSGKINNVHGINNRYTLVNRMFSGNFMNLCSWASAARGEEGKVAFKMYKNNI